MSEVSPELQAASNETIKSRIITKLTKTCEACPSQWECENALGQYVYIRYRWGYLSATIAGRQVYGDQIGGGYAGQLSDEEMRAHLVNVLFIPEELPEYVTEKDEVCPE